MANPVRTYPQALRQSGSSLIEQLIAGRDASGEVGVETLNIAGQRVRRFTTEFWTSRQRQASSLHEISYRACFKPQLPRFFIESLTNRDDVVFDPFMGRGTTLIEAGLLGRHGAGNDANPLSRILTRPRLTPPTYEEVEQRLQAISFSARTAPQLDLTMFYHPRTEAELLALRGYLGKRRSTRKEDSIDRWIRMVATSRLTGHSRGFFSVYTLPPNQAMSAENQKKINKHRRQRPEYRDVKELILRKTKSLLRNVSAEQLQELRNVHQHFRLVTGDAGGLKDLKDRSIRLTVTSPPFLDTVNYAQDNWLRCWFNELDWERLASKIAVVRSIEAWTGIMMRVFRELYRVTATDGIVAFEVGEIRKRNLNLDEFVVPIGLGIGFRCVGILINQQRFTKTSNIWGVRNNAAGTNTNRIVLFQKPAR